jgi:ribonuclease HI
MESPHIQQALTLEMIDRRYLHSEWTHVYTDGSATEAVMNVGSGVYLKYPDGRTTSLSSAGGKICSNFTAEKAITEAADHLVNSDTHGNVVILTDSLSTLLVLSSNNSNEVVYWLRDSLGNLSKNTNAILQWIPAHCGIPGNERVDYLAKEGSRRNTVISYAEAKTIL